MPNSNQKNHKVWLVYDKLRTARLNTKYYSRRLASIEYTNFVINIIICIAAPTSVVSGFFWGEHEHGKIVWQFFGGVATVMILIRPYLNLTNKIKEFGSVLSMYDIMEYDLREIKSSIEQNQKYDAILQHDLRKAIEREKILVGKKPETRERKRVKKICEIEVLEEFPEDSFYIPEEEQ